MSFFWKNDGNLSAPPELSDIKRVRPWGDYWESNARSRGEALETFWIRWKKETGKDYPKPMPSITKFGSHIGFAGNRTQISRRPDHHSEKNTQDARET